RSKTYEPHIDSAYHRTRLRAVRILSTSRTYCRGLRTRGEMDGLQHHSAGVAIGRAGELVIANRRRRSLLVSRDDREGYRILLGQSREWLAGARVRSYESRRGAGGCVGHGGRRGETSLHGNRVRA